MIRPLKEEVRSRLRSGVAITNLTQCVEELVLNSIDAGASSITVRIDVPNFKIQVSDNGGGITFGDLKLVGERYSSSKCHVLKDLEQLTFYGFRGEALASVREICDVLEIVTRHRSSYQTYCKLFRNSQVLELTESKFPRTSSGTTVTVHNIFANLPVRRKSIAETLDFERVRHRIASIALIHPKTAFLLINDSTGAKCLQTHVCKSSISTFSQLFGNHRSKGLQAVEYEHKDFKVSGFISTDVHHSKSLQFLFVNGRLLLKTKIHKLINSILGKSELVRKFPSSEVDSTISECHQTKATSPQNARTVDKHGIFVLNIECLVTEYDICLEPAKTLIEFQDWDSVISCIERCVKGFLIKHNLISSSSPDSGDDDSHIQRSCHTSLEAFEYRREIETSNVKKSLHSSTVFRPRMAETEENGSQDKASGLSDRKHKDNNFNEMAANDSLSGSFEKLASCLDVSNKPTDRHHENHVNHRTTCYSIHTADSNTATASNSVKAAENCSHNVNQTSVDLPSTQPVSRHCVLDSQKTCTSQFGDESRSSLQRNLLNGFSNRNSHNNAYDSHAFSENRMACDSAVCLDKAKDLQTKNLSSDMVCVPVHDTVLPFVDNGSFQQFSVTKPRSTGASSTKVDKSRKSKLMSTFTSPFPITLQGVYTRKRPQANKETSALDSGLVTKSTRIITLQGSCKRRDRYHKDAAEQSSGVKDGECNAHSVAHCGQIVQKLADQSLQGSCKRIARYHKDFAEQSSDVEVGECDVHSVAPCGQIVQKLADQSCNTKSTRTVDGDDITRTPICPDTCTMRNTGINCIDSIPGVTVSSGNTCDSSVSFACNQAASCDSVGQVCLLSFSNKCKQPLEKISVNSAAVSKLNNTRQEGITYKCTELLCCPQKESVAAKKEVFVQQLSHSSASSNVEPSLPTGDKHDTHETQSSLNKEWYRTFDASLGRNLCINTRTGHSSFKLPSEFNVEDDDCNEASEIEGDGIENYYPQHMPHPVASHLSFSCTPWLPREDRRQQVSVCDNGYVNALDPTGLSQLETMYQEHQDIHGAEEKLCKWTDADTLKAYEQTLFNSGSGKTVADMLDSWQNPVFTAPSKDILMANKPGGCIKNQISVHNVVHPYRFTRDMLASMRVLRQVDDKFIVGVLSQAGDDDGLLVLVDQHAAHERIRLEQLQSELFEDANESSLSENRPRLKSSPVCPPLEITLFAEECRLLKTFQCEMERIGIRFVINEASQVSEETSVFLHGVPSVLVEREVSEVKRGRSSVAVSKVKGLIREHLEQVSMTCGVPAVIPKVISEVISSQACHGAVKFGEPLGVTECQELIERLSKCQLPFQCAHGRPSVIPLADLRFLAKKMSSQEVVCRPRITMLQSALVKEH